MGSPGFFFFSILDFMNNAAGNIHVQAFVRTYAFSSLEDILQSRMAGSYSDCIFNYLIISRTTKLFPQGPAPFYILSISAQKCQFPYILVNTYSYPSFFFF